MIKVPSLASAVLAGLCFTPLIVLGGNYIEEHGLGDGVFFVWVLLTFFVPVTVSVLDFSYWRRRSKELGSIFYPMASAEDFRLFYFPAWGRLLAWFIASGVHACIAHYGRTAMKSRRHTPRIDEIWLPCAVENTSSGRSCDAAAC